MSNRYPSFFISTILYSNSNIQKSFLKKIGSYLSVTHKSRIGEGQASVVEPLGALFRLVPGLVQMDEGWCCVSPQPGVLVPAGCLLVPVVDTVSRPVLPRPA